MATKIKIDGGPITAYGAAVEGGYKGTYEEFSKMMANIASSIEFIKDKDIGQILDDQSEEIESLEQDLREIKDTTLQTNLSSDQACPIDGTSPRRIGVTGKLPIENGGTGANTASAARISLDVLPTKHASSNDSYGIGTDMEFGHVKIIDNLTQQNPYSGQALSAHQGYVLDHGKAPVNHASTLTAYGTGTTSSYGHCKVINDLTHSSFANGEALSAYQGYLMKQSFQDGCDAILAACTANGRTPASNSPTNIANTINGIRTGYTQIEYQTYSPGSDGGSITDDGIRNLPIGSIFVIITCATHGNVSNHNMWIHDISNMSLITSKSTELGGYYLYSYVYKVTASNNSLQYTRNGNNISVWIFRLS